MHKNQGVIDEKFYSALVRAFELLTEKNKTIDRLQTELARAPTLKARLHKIVPLVRAMRLCPADQGEDALRCVACRESLLQIHNIVEGCHDE